MGHLQNFSMFQQVNAAYSPEINTTMSQFPARSKLGFEPLSAPIRGLLSPKFLLNLGKGKNQIQI
jgi:hypothetical protein